MQAVGPGPPKPATFCLLLCKQINTSHIWSPATQVEQTESVSYKRAGGNYADKYSHTLKTHMWGQKQGDIVEAESKDIVEAENKPSPDTKPTSTLSLDFPSSSTARNKF